MHAIIFIACFHLGEYDDAKTSNIICHTLYTFHLTPSSLYLHHITYTLHHTYTIHYTLHLISIDSVYTYIYRWCIHHITYTLHHTYIIHYTLHLIYTSYSTHHTLNLTPFTLSYTINHLTYTLKQTHI